MKLGAAGALLALGLAAVGADGVRLVHPLAFRSYCTSSFGEYRLNHFHGGVDFSTRGEEGHQVLAVGDGKIARVRREASGYGRVLYLDLKDGRTAVYGHLIRFSRALGIEGRLHEACREKNSSFPGDVHFDPPIQVKAGDVIAFSGQLGLGSPHLHLEIRKGDEMRDPFAEGIPAPQYSAPVVRGVSLVPRDEGAKVGGSFSRRAARLGRNPDGSYGFREPLVVEGRADVYLMIEDSMGSDTYKTLPTAITAAVDGVEFFRMDLKGISLARYKESPYLFEPVEGEGVYLRLRASGQVKVDEISGDGMPELSEGSHALEITVGNRGGKSAVLRGRIECRGGAARSSAAIPLPAAKVSAVKLYPNGVGMIVEPLGAGEGSTPVTIDGKQVPVFIDGGGGEKLEVLVPASALPQGPGVLAVGGKELQGVFMRGPCSTGAGRFSVELPSGIVSRVTWTSLSVDIDAAPKGPRALARLAAAPDKAGNGSLFASGKAFFAHVGSKPRSLGKSGHYKIMTDGKPPEWGKPSVAVIPNIGERELRIPVTDALSGVNGESVVLYLDGERIYPDWDADASCVRLDLTAVPAGEHSVSGSGRDRAGNEKQLSRTPFLL